MNGYVLREFESPRVVEQLEEQTDHLWIPLDRISRRSTRPLNEKKIALLVDHLHRGGSCKPIIVVEISEDHFCIDGDGRHRYEAHRRADIPVILCRIVRR